MWVFRIPGTLEAREDALDALWQAGASGLEERGGEVRAYFEEPLELPLDGQWTQEPDQDWQEGWKKDLRPVAAGQLTIAPPWLAHEIPADQRPLLIEVGMAFGTGHHATTRLAVEALQDQDLQGRRVLDVGTGSGVLALAAALLGAAQAVGVDLDPVTIPAARENAALNGLQAGSGEDLDAPLIFLEGTLSDVPEGLQTGYDVLIANLYAELHDILMDQYREAVSGDVCLILTGILAEKLALVHSALQREGFTVLDTRTEGEWALVVARA